MPLEASRQSSSDIDSLPRPHGLMFSKQKENKTGDQVFKCPRLVVDTFKSPNPVSKFVYYLLDSSSRRPAQGVESLKQKLKYF